MVYRKQKSTLNSYVKQSHKTDNFPDSYKIHICDNVISQLSN
jgi:hypothetical protein